MTDPTSGWNRLGEALGSASGPGLGAFALLAAVALAAMILFRPQIARLLDRTVVLRVLGVYLLARPGRPDRSEQGRSVATPPGEPPKPPPPAPGA